MVSWSGWFLPDKNLLTTHDHFARYPMYLAETTSSSNWQFIKKSLQEPSVLWGYVLYCVESTYLPVKCRTKKLKTSVLTFPLLLQLASIIFKRSWPRVLQLEFPHNSQHLWYLFTLRQVACCWVLTPCSVVLLYRRFKRTSYLHFQSHSSVMFMETTGFSEIVVPIVQIKLCRTFDLLCNVGRSWIWERNLMSHSKRRNNLNV